MCICVFKYVDTGFQCVFRVQGAHLCVVQGSMSGILLCWTLTFETRYWPTSARDAPGSQPSASASPVLDYKHIPPHMLLHGAWEQMSVFRLTQLTVYKLSHFSGPYIKFLEIIKKNFIYFLELLSFLTTLESKTLLGAIKVLDWKQNCHQRLGIISICYLLVLLCKIISWHIKNEDYKSNSFVLISNFIFIKNLWPSMHY